MHFVSYTNCFDLLRSTATNWRRLATVFACLNVYAALRLIHCVHKTAPFLPRCMECRRGLTMRFLSVCLSVCLSNACIVTKRKKDMFRFLPRCMECRCGLTMRFLSVCLSVRLSVCLSVKRVHCDKTEKSYVQIFISYERTFILVLWEEEWLVGRDPFYLKFWVNRPALERNRRFWTDDRS